MSLGLLRRLPSKVSIRVSTGPSPVEIETRRLLGSQVTRRPVRSKVRPLLPPEGSRKISAAPSGAILWMRLAGMSLKSQWPSRCQTGPSTN